MENGIIPWEKPWRGIGAPRNIRGYVYRGCNAMLLASANYESPFWMTFQQAESFGAKVRRGEHGWPILLIDKKIYEDDDGDKRSVTLVKYWNVFNTEQIDDLPDKVLPKLPPVKDVPTGNALIKRMKDKPPITHGGSAAGYNPKTDKIDMPRMNRFKTGDHYYATLFHELTHSTGHESRLKRNLALYYEDKEKYGAEELIAEIGSAALCHECGIWETTHGNAAAYLKHWISAIKGDRSFLVTAMSHADKAVNFLLGIKPEPYKPTKKATK